jgi:hypothetical protein
MMERLQRAIAAIVGLFTASSWVYGTFTDPNPSFRSIWVILFRLVWSALILYIFLRRAVGRRMDSLAWAGFALLVVPGIWESKTRTGSIVCAISGALILLGARIEMLQQRAAQQRVAADGAAPHR